MTTKEMFAVNNNGLFYTQEVQNITPAEVKINGLRVKRSKADGPWYFEQFEEALYKAVSLNNLAVHKAEARLKECLRIRSELKRLLKEGKNESS